MIDKNLVIDLVENYLKQDNNNGLYLVDITISNNNRIVIELSCRNGISIDDCVKITKFIENNLDREVEDYELEVGSCGITSSFKILRQYLDNIGSEVELLRKGGVKYKGVLKSATEENIVLEVEKKVKLEDKKRKVSVIEVQEIPMTEVLQTKRVIKI